MVDHDSAVDQNRSESGETISQMYDWSDERPSAAVVETVAAAMGLEPTELQTLQRTVDADALDTLVREAGSETTLRVDFRYAGTGVQIGADGTVSVTVE